jgi:hypothetical protein
MDDDRPRRGPFNTPLETGFRSVAVLAAAYPLALDLQRLLLFDYLVVHSADAGGPPSLHPATPLRNGELLVRRALVESGLLLMVSRRLLERVAGDAGIAYRATDEATPFLDRLRAPYAMELKSRACWVADGFAALPDDELRRFVDLNFGRWTREFQAIEQPGRLG